MKSLAGIGALSILVGCSDLPSKSDALLIVQQSVKEEAVCTLPVTLLSRLKTQYATKALCVPREGGPPMDAAAACLEALTKAGATKPMPPGYMAEWPDELSGAGFDSVSPYERRARHLLFKGCFEMSPDLREGRFRCGEARADKVVRVTKKPDGRALVRYSRAIKLSPNVDELDRVCGAITRPPQEEEATLEKTEGKRWVMSTSDEATNGTR